MPRLLVTSLLVLASVASLQANAGAQSGAQADSLFKDGKRLMGEQNYREACTAFEASYKLDPAVTTLVNHADCREKNAQYASAWGLFLEVDRQTRADKQQAALNKTAKTRAAALEPRLSYLIISVPDESRVDGLSISQNGAVVDPLTWNRALPVDGGVYVIEGKAPGHEPWQTRVTVQAALDKQSVDVPKFKSVPKPDPVVDPDPRTATGDGASGPRRFDGPPPSGMSGRRKTSLGLAAVGAGGLIAAVVFELGAQSKHDEASKTPDDALQAALQESAQSKRKLALITGGLGIACVGVAAYLWFTDTTATSMERTAWHVVPDVGGERIGLSLAGGF